MRTARPRAHALLLLAAALAWGAAGCSGGGSPKPIPADQPVTITTATPYARPPAPTIVNADGVVAGGTPPAGGPREVVYRLEAGDTVLALATKFGTTVEAIVKRNNITNPAALKIGEELVIPTTSTVLATATPTVSATPTATAAASATPRATATAAATARATSTATAPGTATPSAPGILTVYTVQKNDNAFDIAGRFGVSVEDLAAANGKTVAQLASIQIGDQLNIPRPR